MLKQTNAPNSHTSTSDHARGKAPGRVSRSASIQRKAAPMLNRLGRLESASLYASAK